MAGRKTQRRPSEELLARLPSLVEGAPGEGMRLVHTVIAGRTRDERAEALVGLAARLGDARGREKTALTFYVEVYALLFTRGGPEMLSRAFRQVLGKKRK